MPLNVDTSVVESASVSQEASQLLMQIEEVYQQRKDQLGQLLTLLKKTKRFKLYDIEIEDPDVVKGISIGISIANNIMGEFPAKICRTSEVHGDEEE